MSRRPFVIAAGLILMAASARAQSSSPPPAPPPFQPTMTLGGFLQGELDAGDRGDSRFPASNRFFLRRGRVTVSGSVMPTLIYRIQGDFAGGFGSASGVSAALTDGYIEWTKAPAAHVRFGQFKAPFGREWLVSSTQLVTVERSLASDRLTLNRQIGVAVTGDLQGGRLGYTAGMFNGNGRNTTVNDNNRFMYVVRGTATPWRRGAGASLEIGANAVWSRDTRLSMPGDFGLDSTPETAAADNLLTGDRRGTGVDLHAERAAWRLDAEFLRVRFDQAGIGQPEVIGQGGYVQPGVFIHKRLVQLVGRYERFEPDTHRDDAATTTWLGGVNYYARGTAVKLMVDYLWVDTPADPDAHHKTLAQLQVTF